jgi:hypothetical protein
VFAEPDQRHLAWLAGENREHFLAAPLEPRLTNRLLHDRGNINVQFPFGEQNK